MGVLPGYAAIGVAAPILLVVLRIVQGIGVGGEWGGSVLMSMEWGSQQAARVHGQLAPARRPDRSAAVHRRGPADVGAAGAGPSTTWGWRVPFLVSIVLVGDRALRAACACWRARRSAGVREAAGGRPAAGVEVIKEQPREILTSAFVRMSEQAPFYLFITFVLTYGTEQLGLEPRTCSTTPSSPRPSA